LVFSTIVVSDFKSPNQFSPLLPNCQHFLYFTVLFHPDCHPNCIPIYSFGSIDSSFVNPRQALFRSHFRSVAFKASGTYAKTAPNTHIKHMILNGIF
jgi:hypothetical protein